jgi:hypothetical protein
MFLITSAQQIAGLQPDHAKRIVTDYSIWRIHIKNQTNENQLPLPNVHAIIPLQTNWYPFLLEHNKNYK